MVRIACGHRRGREIMRRIRDVLGLCGLVFAAVAGCALSESNQVKPPRPAEEFRAPPESDPRYARPIEYPKDTMDQDMLLKKTKENAKGTPGPMRPGMGGGPGGGRGF
jgi:hypothetical protein